MTGQFPKRRETDEQASARTAELEKRRATWAAGARKLGAVEEKLFARPRISASGRLV